MVSPDLSSPDHHGGHVPPEPIEEAFLQARAVDPTLQPTKAAALHRELSQYAGPHGNPVDVLIKRFNTVYSRTYPSGDDGTPLVLLSFGHDWPDAAALPSFVELIKKHSRLGDITDKVGAALTQFEDRLRSSFDGPDLDRFSGLSQYPKPHLKRDHLNFFFSPCMTSDGVILLTVFLEAHPAELLARPRAYENADKNLFTTYFSTNGVVRREDSEFERDKAITGQTENTAYAKFYIQKWGGNNPGISILIHPMQRARLLYAPERLDDYRELKAFLHESQRQLKIWSAKEEHRGGGSQELAAGLRSLGEITERLRDACFKSNHGTTVEQGIEDLSTVCMGLEGRSRRFNIPTHPRSVSVEALATGYLIWARKTHKDDNFPPETLILKMKDQFREAAALLTAEGVKMSRHPSARSRAQGLALEELGAAMGGLAEQVGTPDAYRAIGRLGAVIEKLSESSDKLLAEVTLNSIVHPSLTVSQYVNRICQRLRHSADCWRKGEAHTEAHYLSADRVTGADRERVFFGISGLLKDELEKATGLPVHRFMLSSDQLDQVRLFREGGAIRDRIKEVPRQLEALGFPVITTRYPLVIVDGDGNFSERTSHIPISTICLDPDTTRSQNSGGLQPSSPPDGN